MRRLLAQLNRPAPGFAFDRAPRGDATPHVECGGPEFDWVVSEHGQEYERRSVGADELLFITLQSLTCRMAMDEELRTRTTRKRLFGNPRATHDDDYSRATWMQAHVRLMASLHGHWGDRVRREHDAPLRRFPLTPAESANARRMDLSDFGLD